MHQRNAIEGTISELVRGHGLRRARYRGLAKADLQNQLIAAAYNIKRWFQKLQGTIFAAPREDAALSGGSLREVLANYFVQIDPRSFWAKAIA
jgi:Transposase DDE domain